MRTRVQRVQFAQLRGVTGIRSGSVTVRARDLDSCALSCRTDSPGRFEFSFANQDCAQTECER